MNFGGLQRTDMETEAVATLSLTSDSVYQKKSTPKNPLKGVYLKSSPCCMRDPCAGCEIREGLD